MSESKLKNQSTVDLLMLIDDNKIDTFVNEKVVKISKFATGTVTMHSCREALSYIEANLSDSDKIPELLFLDLNMPVMNGFNFLEAIDKLPNHQIGKCKVVVLSSSDNARDKEQAMANKHVIGFLSKPLTSEKLELVERLIKGLP